MQNWIKILYQFETVEVWSYNTSVRTCLARSNNCNDCWSEIGRGKKLYGGFRVVIQLRRLNMVGSFVHVPKSAPFWRLFIYYIAVFDKKTRTVLAVYFGGLFYSSVISFFLVHIRIWLRRLNMWTLTCPQYQIYQQTKKKHVLNIANLLLCGKIFFCFFIV